MSINEKLKNLKDFFFQKSKLLSKFKIKKLQNKITRRTTHNQKNGSHSF